MKDRNSSKSCFIGYEEPSGQHKLHGHSVTIYLQYQNHIS